MSNAVRRSSSASVGKDAAWRPSRSRHPPHCSDIPTRSVGKLAPPLLALHQDCRPALPPAPRRRGQQVPDRERVVTVLGYPRPLVGTTALNERSSE